MALFEINVAWRDSMNEYAHSPDDEEYSTAGDMRITANDRCLTRCLDKKSEKVKSGPLLSAYPLALWLTGAWWRVLYEPCLSDDIRKAPSDWRMSHELASIGEGYAWPPLQFDSDGENLSIRFQEQSEMDRKAQPIEYHGEKTQQIIPLEAAPKEFSRFVDATLSRLESRNFRATELHEAWKQLQIECSDPEMTAYRIVEARLGYNPDGAPEEVMNLMERIERQFGKQIASEMSAICNRHESDENQEQRLRSIWNMSRQGLRCRFPDISVPVLPDSQLPWEYGRELAREIRNALGTSPDTKLDNDTLYGVFKVKESQTQNASYICEDNFSLCRKRNENLSIVFKKESSEYYKLNRRFFMARLLAACLHTKDCETFLPVTASKTWLQRMQRSFAAELLAPIESIRAIVGEKNYPTKWIKMAADTFQVSPLLIINSLVNHGDINYKEAWGYCV